MIVSTSWTPDDRVVEHGRMVRIVHFLRAHPNGLPTDRVATMLAADRLQLEGSGAWHSEVERMLLELTRVGIVTYDSFLHLWHAEAPCRR